MPSHYWTPERKEKWIAEQLRNIEDPIQRAIFLNKLYTDGTISQIEQEKETMRISKIDQKEKEQDEKETRQLQKEIAREQRAEAKTLRLREEKREYDEGKAKTAAEKKAEEARIKAEEKKIAAKEELEDSLRDERAKFQSFESFYDDALAKRKKQFTNEKTNTEKELAKVEDLSKQEFEIQKLKNKLKDIGEKTITVDKAFGGSRSDVVKTIDGVEVGKDAETKIANAEKQNRITQFEIDFKQKQLEVLKNKRNELQTQLNKIPANQARLDQIPTSYDFDDQTDYQDLFIKDAVAEYSKLIKKRMRPGDVPTPQY
jgi:hypothetical protein